MNSRYLDFAPRFGLAWDPTGSGKWSIRTSYSVFFDQPEVVPLLITVSFAFVIGSLGMTQAALMERAMRFRSSTTPRA